MLEGKICLVTGSTSGIGKEIAIGLANSGGSVVIVGRDSAKCESVVAEIAERSGGSAPPASILLADLSSQSSIRNAAKEFKDRYSRLDVLVNNAGVFRACRETTEEGIEYTFAVNHIATFLMTHLLMDRLVSGSARVVTTSSIAHRGSRIDFDDIQFAKRRYNGIRAYGQSKLANILFTKELACRLEGTGVLANCFHPGGVRTGLARGNPWYYKIIWQIIAPFLIGPEKGADTGIYLATSDQVNSITGGYFVKRRQVTPSSEAQDAASASRLWEVSEELTGTKSP